MWWDIPTKFFTVQGFNASQAWNTFVCVSFPHTMKNNIKSYLRAELCHGGRKSFIKNTPQVTNNGTVEGNTTYALY